jgi:hypothetical protein
MAAVGEVVGGYPARLYESDGTVDRNPFRKWDPAG